MPRTRTAQSETSWPQAIIEYIAKHPDRPLKARGLGRELKIPERAYPGFRALVREMLADGRLALGSGRRLALPTRGETFSGIFRPHQRGFGFIERSDGPDAYVPRGQRQGAFDGDLVEARLAKSRRSPDRPRAEIIRIIRRASLKWVGVLDRITTKWFLHPLGKADAPLVNVTNPSQISSRKGDMVVIEADPESLHTRAVRGRIVENLGDSRKAGAKILSVIRRYGLRDRFGAEVEDEARRAAADFDPDDLDRREDLRKRITITIDPVDARDFDDAISLRRLPHGQFELGVHIADVARFVQPGNALDQEALKRGTSVYLPGRVLPMLPETLSNNLCSLKPGESRLTKSVFITYDRQGGVKSTRMANSVIRSNARLTYEQVTTLLEKKKSPISPTVARLIRSADTLARLIRRRRLAEGMIALSTLEVELRFNKNGEPIDAGAADTSFSHTIIEMFMVEANEAVSRHLTERDEPHLRRIHPEPLDDDLKRFSRVCNALGLTIAAVPNRKQIGTLLDQVRGQAAAPAVNLLLLRCLSQACYSPEQQQHYALASQHYCHFTSPIRRYPDLLVHRLLDTHLRGEAKKRKTRSGRKRSESLDLARLGREASTSERRAQQAERDARNMLLLGLMKSKVGEQFDGIITGTTPFGAFVQISPYLAEGLVHINDFGPDAWEYDSETAALLNTHSRRAVMVGQKIRVTVAAVDEFSRKCLWFRAIRPSWGAPEPVFGPREKAANRREHAPRVDARNAVVADCASAPLHLT